MPSQTRSRKPKKSSRKKPSLTIGGAVSLKSGAVTHLNKVERKDVKRIIASRKEKRYSPDWTKYDIFDAYAGLLQPQRGTPVDLFNIAPAGFNVCSALAFQTGHYLTSQSNEMNTFSPGMIVPIGGYSLQQGSSAVTRDGDYAYLQSAVMKLQITAVPLNTNNSDVYSRLSNGLQFRVLHFQSKKINTGVVPNPVTQLFLDQTNNKVGLDMSGSVKEIMDDFHFNTAQFTLHKDIKFRLTQPQIVSTSEVLAVNTSYVNQAIQGQGCNPTYPSTRNLTLWMPKTKKKIRFLNADNGTTNYYEPTNYDYNNVVLIICTRINIERTMDNSLSTSRAWSVKANGETRYRDS